MEFYLPHINTDVMVGIIAFLLVYYFALLKGYSKKKRRTAPEAGGAWPIIGHLHLLGGSTQLPHKTLGAMADKYGPIFRIRVGVHRILVVSNSEIAKECFTTHDSALSCRPKYAAAKHIGYNYAMFGFSPYGPYWRQLRKIVSLELLGQRRLELLKHVRVSETESSIKELHKIWTEKKDNSGFVLMEMKQWLLDLSLNVVVRMVVGKRYFGGGGGGGEQALLCQKLFRDFFRFLGMSLASDVFPFLGWLDLGGHEKAMKETAKEMDELAAGWLEEHRRKRDSGEVKGDQDFMGFMISTLEGADLADYDVDTINKATCLNLIAGGADTNGIMLTWALALLMNNRHVLKKAQEELDIHVGKERQVDESDISKLAYLQAIVKEAIRLYPPGPLLPREFTDDCTIGGYHVPKGTRLMVNLWKLQRDPTIWSEPSEFRPERFLTTQKDMDFKGQQHFSFIPFGAGRRVCPGITFGVQMLHLVLARLLHGFELSTPSNHEPVDMTESAGLTNIKATPLEILLAPRLSPDLY